MKDDIKRLPIDPEEVDGICRSSSELIAVLTFFMIITIIALSI